MFANIVLLAPPSPTAKVYLIIYAHTEGIYDYNIPTFIII